MEQARRPALEDHVHWSAPMGARVLIKGSWYYSVDRVGRGACYIDNLSISLLGGIQPAVLRKIISDCGDDGLIQRLIPVTVKSATTGKDEERPEAVKDYNDLV